MAAIHAKGHLCATGARRLGALAEARSSREDLPRAGGRGSFLTRPDLRGGIVRTIAIITCLIIGANLGAQNDSTRVPPNTQTGAWSATSGTMALMGSWTAVPDAAHGTVTGTWTLNDNQGKTVMSGLWSASKANDRWYGNWRANVEGQSGEYTGSWDSSVEHKAGNQFTDLFEKAVFAVVNGTWRSGGKSGAWAIRTAKSPP
jgi:hypothetical protein